MNILVIDGSPRVGKNTDRLCDAFIEGAKSKGHTATKFRVAGKKINGCIHCMQCYKNGPCSQKDDMLPVYDMIEAADMVVLASPIYFWDITAQTKAVIDRMFALYVAGRFTPKQTAAIFVSGGKDMSNMTEAVDFYNNVIIDKLHWVDRGYLTVTGTTPEDFDVEAEGYLQKAFDLGAAL